MKSNIQMPDLSIYKDKRLIIMQGASGSGKSTLAHYMAEELGGVVVSRDTLRENLIGKNNISAYYEQKMDYSVEEEITKCENYTLAKILKSGKIAIVDDTHLRLKYVVETVRIALDCGISENQIVIAAMPKISLDESDKRVALRGHSRVDREVIARQIAVRDSINWGLPEAIEAAKKLPAKKWHLPPFEVIPYVADTSKPKAFLFDIDGTLAKRKLLREPKIHYRSFYDYAAVETDEANESLVTIIRALQCLNNTHPEDVIHIIFVSGRKEDSREVTEQFLNSLPLGLKQLYMRDPVIDKIGTLDAPDDKVKYRLFNENIRDRYNVLGVFDDRKRVVALWEALGLQVFNVGKLNEEF